ncbi:MAG: tyrosine decarboxylase MfnA [Spirochaetaceae bacterium]
MKILKLKKRLSGDHDFKGHTILGSMCTEPHYLAKRTFRRFLSTNVGDPGLFPNLIDLETEYIASLGYLLHDNTEAKGMVVSGGSEANILAMWSAREMAGENKRDVIIPETCHFSFDKAAMMLGLNLVKIPVDSKHKVRIDLVEKAINENTMAIVGIAGTTGSGACDPIDGLSELAVKHNLYLHVDAAFGGFVFPFLDNPPLFDFRLPGVKSITMDPHKMGRAVIQSGCIIYRNQEVYDSVKVPVGYLSGGKTINNSILGTRSGASIASSWMVFNYLGFEGYKKEVDKLMLLTAWFAEEVKNIPELNTIIEPECNIVGICSSGDVDIKVLLKKLRNKGWALSEWSNYVRITMMPHVKKAYLKKFLKDIKSILITL